MSKLPCGKCGHKASDCHWSKSEKPDADRKDNYKNPKRRQDLRRQAFIEEEARSVASDDLF
eukprot:CAMPEP_0167754244 /NCGR_PEP_ID=MMETSP0110_2-20121227/8160_1 /TAXON_ID=629695 /ORGANISM="Gymnochlora sp., Strain CCMP2014" /LENGTH=60 /DNA_ID=CAMNT_0007640097 /DNA_START=519 /DNA_END=701 /DNA_ORIENTATION=+